MLGPPASPGRAASPAAGPSLLLSALSASGSHVTPLKKLPRTHTQKQPLAPREAPPHLPPRPTAPRCALLLRAFLHQALRLSGSAAPSLTLFPAVQARDGSR